MYLYTFDRCLEFRLVSGKPTLFTDGVQGFTPSNYRWAAIASGVEIVIDLKRIRQYPEFASVLWLLL